MSKKDNTKSKIIEAAFEEFYHNGYHGTGLNAILKKANVTKGALYHHFHSKKELTLEMIKSIFSAYVQKIWIEPFNNTEKPIETLITSIRNIPTYKLTKNIDYCHHHGCPLNNLIQEIGPTDIDFANALGAIYVTWKDTVKQVLQKEQNKGAIKKETDIDSAALFIISAIEGCIMTAKTVEREEAQAAYEQCTTQLFIYIRSL